MIQLFKTGRGKYRQIGYTILFLLLISLGGVFLTKTEAGYDDYTPRTDPTVALPDCAPGELVTVTASNGTHQGLNCVSITEALKRNLAALSNTCTNGVPLRYFSSGNNKGFTCTAEGTTPTAPTRPAAPSATQLHCSDGHVIRQTTEGLECIALDTILAEAITNCTNGDYLKLYKDETTGGITCRNRNTESTTTVLASEGRDFTRWDGTDCQQGEVMIIRGGKLGCINVIRILTESTLFQSVAAGSTARACGSDGYLALGQTEVRYKTTVTQDSSLCANILPCQEPTATNACATGATFDNTTADTANEWRWSCQQNNRCGSCTNSKAPPAPTDLESLSFGQSLYLTWRTPASNSHNCSNIHYSAYLYTGTNWACTGNPEDRSVVSFKYVGTRVTSSGQIYDAPRSGIPNDAAFSIVAFEKNGSTWGPAGPESNCLAPNLLDPVCRTNTDNVCQIGEAEDTPDETITKK